ncbi:MAG: penicillin-binding protein 1A, partial [Bradymonadia bacterium]
MSVPRPPLILRTPTRTRLGRLVRLLCAVGAIGLNLAVLLGLILYGHFAQNLPPIPGDDLRADRPTMMRARDGRLAGQLGRGDRVTVVLHALPPYVVQAFLAIEDQRFFRHGGVDLIGTARAVVANWIAGRTVQGASTLTQQLCKVRVGNARSYARKAREAILARRTEAMLSKAEILRLYLDTVYLGQGAYGLGAAARRYFGKHASALSLGEAALLAGLPPRPSALNPVRDRAGSRARRGIVLARMVDEGFITARQAGAANAEPISLRRPANIFREVAPHFVERARIGLGVDVFDAGLDITLTLDAQAHAGARAELNAGLTGLARRQGFRGSLPGAERWRPLDIKGVQPGRVRSVTPDSAIIEVGAQTVSIALAAHRWMAPFEPDSRRNRNEIESLGEALTPGMVVLIDPDAARIVPRPQVESAFVSLDWRTGAVGVLVGGRDFDESEFHRVFQGCRQPGSAFKPFVYGLALDDEYTLASLLDDTPLVWSESGSDYLYKPRNAGKYLGDVLLLRALAASKNVPTIRLLTAVGAARVARFAETLGIDTPLHAGPALALGSSCVRPWSLTRALGTFATDGRAVRPFLVARVIDAQGRVRLDRTPPSDPYAPLGHRLDGLLRALFEPAPALIDARTAWLTRFAMRRVVRGGTASGARRLGVPVAGKTGTT